MWTAAVGCPLTVFLASETVARENAGAACLLLFGYILMYFHPILLTLLILVWAFFVRSRNGLAARP